MQEQLRTISLLFTDLVGSTELLTKVGDEAAEAIRRTHFRLLREAVRDRGGQEVKNLGDGLMVVFNSALDAIDCGVDVQRRVHRLNLDAPDRQMQVRVGIHVGEPIRDEDDYFGTSVVVAKRLCDAADGGEVLISDLVYRLVGSRGTHRFEDRGSVALKGLDETHAYRLAWEPIEHSRLPLPVGVDLSAGHSAPFVGRAEAMAELRAAWGRMLAGGRQVVVVGGEAGMGKTRLVAELAAELHGEGAAVLYGRCDEDNLVPYQPFAEAVRHVLKETARDELRLHLPASASQLARLVPDMEDRLPRFSPQVLDEPGAQRHQLFEALASLLCRLSTTHPVLLVLDDLHWIDQPTSMMLRHLIRSTGHCRVLVVGTWRDEEIGRRSPLREMLPELRRDPDFASLRLGGLPEDAVRELMTTEAGHELRADGVRLAGMLVRETEGNPFFLNEILLHLVEEGSLYRDDGGRWQTRGRRYEDLGIPESVWDVIGRRLSNLDEATRRDLEVAAVMGRDFGLEALREVTEHGETILLEHLEEAIEARVIRELPGSFGRYTFEHALFRQYLYRGISTTRRVRLHHLAGTVIERLHTSDLESHFGVLAHHFLEATRGGDFPIAIEYARLAGERALAVLAFEEAIEYYRRALGVLDYGRIDDPSARCRLNLGLGLASTRAGHLDAGRKAYLEAADLAAALGDGALVAQAALGYAGVLGGYSYAVNYDEALVAQLQRGLEMVGNDDSEERVRLLARLAVELRREVTTDHGLAMATQAREMAERLQSPSARLVAMFAQAQLKSGPDHTPQQHLDSATELLDLARLLGDREMRFRGHHLRLLSLLELGRTSEVDVEIAACAALAEEMRMPLYRWQVAVFEGMRAFLDGDFRAADRAAERGMEAGKGTVDDPAIIAISTQLFMQKWLRGGLDELQDAVRDMVANYPDIPAWRSALALYHAELGRPEEARWELAQFARQGFAQLPRDRNWLAGVCLLAFAAYRIGDAANAGPLYALLVMYPGRGVVVGACAVVMGDSSQFLGMLAETLGRPAEARAHYEEALDRLRGGGNRPFLVECLYRYSGLLLASGDDGDQLAAHALLDEALQVSRELELDRFTLLCEERLIAAGEREDRSDYG